MRKVSLALLVLMIVAACQAITAIDLPSWPVVGAPRTSPTLTLSPAAYQVPDTPVPQVATLMPSSTPYASPTLEPTPAATARPSNPVGFTVRVHPENGVYVGDQVSFEVIAPVNEPQEGDTVRVKVDGDSPQDLGEQEFSRYGIGGRRQATFLWAWNTDGMEPKDYEVAFSVQPGGLVFTETITLLPEYELPADQAGAYWEEAQSECCTIQYITGTEAERDLEALMVEMDDQADDASRRMGIALTETITVTLIPRVLGHGGFASDEIGISYLDRNYAGGSLAMILHHELIHMLDSRLGGDLRPSLFVEGLAVYLSGGHYKLEPLMSRAAALLDKYGNPEIQGLDWYIPLETLADEFYSSQHELGYLEAGALVEYMVERWGWQEFSDFYRDIHPDDSGSQTRAIDRALQSHFELSFAELDRDFIAALQHEPVTPEMLSDVRLTVELYDTLRRYQKMLDPSAYFLYAWLLDTAEMRQRGIVADYIRHPDAPINIEIEIALQDAARFLQEGNYVRAEERIEIVNTRLDLIEE